MKTLLSTIFSLLFVVSHAGSLRNNVDQQFLNSNSQRNYIKNSGAEVNDYDVTDVSAIHSRTIVTPIKGDGSHLIDATASGQIVCFTAEDLQIEQLGGACEARFKYTGDASLYKAYGRMAGVIASDNVNNQLANISSGSGTFSATFPCGTSTTDDPQVCVESTSASAAAIKVDSVYIGEALGIGSVAQATEFFTATRDSSFTATNNGASALQITGLTASLDTLNGFASNNYTIRRGGTYLITADVFTGAGTSTKNVTVQVNSTYNFTVPCSTTAAFPSCSGTRSLVLNRNDVVRLMYNNFTPSETWNVNNFSIIQESVPASETIARLDAPGAMPTAYTPTFTNFTAASSTFYYQCVAPQRVAIWGRVTSTAAGSGSEARVGMPTSFDIDTTAAGATTIVGHGGRSSNAAAAYSVLSNGNAGYLTFGAQASGNAALTTLTGAQVFDAAVTFSFSATVPVTAASPCAKNPQILIPGSVYSSSAGSIKIDAANLTIAGATCTQNTSQSTQVFTGLSRPGIGQCTASFGTAFSQTPVCHVTSLAGGSVASLASLSTTGFTAIRRDLTAIAAGVAPGIDGDFSIICVGFR